MNCLKPQQMSLFPPPSEEILLRFLKSHIKCCSFTSEFLAEMTEAGVEEIYRYCQTLYDPMTQETMCEFPRGSSQRVEFLKKLALELGVSYDSL